MTVKNRVKVPVKEWNCSNFIDWFHFIFPFNNSDAITTYGKDEKLVQNSM